MKVFPFWGISEKSPCRRMLLISSHDIYMCIMLDRIIYEAQFQNHLPSAAVVSWFTVIVLVTTRIIFLQNIELGRPIRRAANLSALLHDFRRLLHHAHTHTHTHSFWSDGPYFTFNMSFKGHPYMLTLAHVSHLFSSLTTVAVHLFRDIKFIRHF